MIPLQHYQQVNNNIHYPQGQRSRCLLYFLKYLLAAAALWYKKARCAAANLTQKKFIGAAIFWAARQNAPYIRFTRFIPSLN